MKNIDGTERVSTGIGETRDEITALHPLPLPFKHLIQAKFFTNYQILRKQVDFYKMQFIKDSKFIHLQLHNQFNPIHIKRLLQERFKSESLVEIQNQTETVLIKATCLHKKIKNTRSKYPIIYCFQTSLCCRHFTISKRIVAQLQSMLESFQQEKTLISIPMIESITIIFEISKQYWDINLFFLSPKFTCEILKVSAIGLINKNLVKDCNLMNCLLNNYHYIKGQDTTDIIIKVQHQRVNKIALNLGVAESKEISQQYYNNKQSTYRRFKYNKLENKNKYRSRKKQSRGIMKLIQIKLEPQLRRILTKEPRILSKHEETENIGIILLRDRLKQKKDQFLIIIVRKIKIKK